jgi:TonB-linked SusC/RagA family outer membrane protein
MIFRKLLSVLYVFACLPLSLIGQQKKSGMDTSVKNDTVLPQLAKKQQVLYKIQNENTRIQSVSSVSGRELEKLPVFNLNNALYGKLTGLFARQSSGDPGDDAGSVTLRGFSPLVLVDGIPRSITGINPEQIESVTVLKDALATAMLGMRGNGGAILITTRKGTNMKNQLNLSINTGWQTLLKVPKTLRAYDYAMLYNEALANDGKPAAYTADDLQAYKKIRDPYAHPNIDWKKMLLRNAARFTRYNLNIGGSGTTYRYFLSLDYLNQQGIFQQSDVNSYNTNSGYKRYNLRGNMEVDINKYLTASLNVFGRIQDENEPGVGSASLFNNLLQTPANAYPVFNPDRSLGGNQSFQQNLYGQLINSGYLQGFTRDAGADVTIKRKLDDVVKGLWIKGTISFLGSLSQTTNRSRKLEVFQMNVGQAHDTTYQKYGSRVDQVNTSTTDSWNQQVYSEVSVGYAKTIKKHSLEAIVLANNQTYRNNPSELPYIFKGVNANVAYNYDGKYILELGGNYSGNNRFPVGRQAGFFPAAGIGWNIAQERFFEKLQPVIQVLKLRGSAGKTANANPGYYVFDQYYNSATGYNIGGSGSGLSGATEATIANPNITWEKADKLNAGIDLAMWKNKIYISVDYFNNRYTDMLRSRGRNTAILGNTYPNENIGIYRYSGMEFAAALAHQIGKLQLNASVNLATLKTRTEYIDEVLQPYSWMQRTGNKLGQTYGYIAEGFYQDQNDINTSAKPDGYVPVPGDLKYKDLNADGIINVFDETALSTTKPELYLGATIHLGYRGFEFSLLVNAVKNRDIMLSGIGQYEFTRFENGIGQAYQHHLNRWTPSKAATATYPRLTVNGNPNNHRVSSFWLHSGNYLRIRNAELAYNFSNGLLDKMRIDRFRVFANAFNLLTFTKLDRVDPEVTGGYPNSRTVSIGASIRFK